jgi:hypothetical protein
MLTDASVIEVSALRHELCTPHLLQLLVKVAFSIALDYTLEKETR